MNMETLYKRPSAWTGHLEFAEWLIRKKKPQIFVELGSHWGHSYFAFCKSVKEASLDTRCFSVDTWRGDSQAGSYDEEVYDAFTSINADLFASFSTPLRMTFDDALPLFADKSIGLLHIDGLHTYDHVRHDFETWLPKMEDDGIVLLHDTCVMKDDFGVWKFWNELKGAYPNHLEFSHSHGLGVLNLSREPRELTAWIRGAVALEIDRFLVKGRCQELEEALQRSRDALHHQSVANVILERKIRGMESSWSWKLTSPARTLQNLVFGGR